MLNLTNNTKIDTNTLSESDFFNISRNNDLQLEVGDQFYAIDLALDGVAPFQNSGKYLALCTVTSVTKTLAKTKEGYTVKKLVSKRNIKAVSHKDLDFRFKASMSNMIYKRQVAVTQFNEVFEKGIESVPADLIMELINKYQSK